MPNEPCGQVAAPSHGTARVRFEFAGRAHRREFTPRLEIKRKENKVKEKEEKFEKKMKRNERRIVLPGSFHYAPDELRRRFGRDDNTIRSTGWCRSWGSTLR